MLQTVLIVALVGSDLDQWARLAFVEDWEDRKIGPVVDVGNLDQVEDTIQGEEHHKAC